EGRLDAVGRPSLAEGLEIGDRRREERRLGVLGAVENVGGSVEGEPADRLAEGGISGGKDGRRGWERGGERPPHADGLRSLAGEDKGRRGHRSQGSRGIHAQTARRVRDCTQEAPSGYSRAR